MVVTSPNLFSLLTPRSFRDYFINMVYFLVKITKDKLDLVYNIYQGLRKYK